MFIPVSAVIATVNRPARLTATIATILEQSYVPAELIVVDGSVEPPSAIGSWEKQFEKLQYVAAVRLGAASQRGQGVAAASHEYILFFDDDVDLQPDCLRRLWEALQGDLGLGGVNATIINQQYHPPGAFSRWMFTLMHGRAEETFAGKVIGPAINLLPEDRNDLPEVVPVEWLNTTCTMYRREVLPSPAFDDIFTGYSLMEDVTLSRRVATAGWKLGNVRRAQIFHHSHSAADKQDIAAMAFMEFRNRRYVMTEILNRRSFSDYLRLGLWECFTVVSGLTNAGGFQNLPKVLTGKLRALFASGSLGRFRT